MDCGIKPGRAIMKYFFAFVFIYTSAQAQVDGPPQEAPYVTVDLNADDRSQLTKPFIKQHPELETKSSRYIDHPNAQKGLYLIDQQGVYHYKTNLASEQKHALSLKIGSVPVPNITYILDDGNEFSFADMYGETNLVQVNVDYEFRIFKDWNQLLGQLGFGFYTATGNGYFKSSYDPNFVPLEKYNFYAIPVSLGLTFRFRFSDKQWFVPYVSGGGVYYGLAELRDDGKKNKFVGVGGGYGAAGVMFSITSWSRDLQFKMDSEYGINNMWLTAEYRTVHSASKDLDIGADYASFGFTVDY